MLVENMKMNLLLWAAILSLSSRVGLASPRIDFMWVDEKLGQLKIYGEFVPGTLTVIAGGVSLSLVEATDSLLIAELPLNGPGSDGEIIVSDITGLSESRRLTSWWLQLSEHYDFDGGSAGGENYDYRIWLHLRADLESYRLSDLAKARKFSVSPSQNSWANYSYLQRDFMVNGWEPYIEGGASIPWNHPDSTAKNRFNVVATVYSEEGPAISISARINATGLEYAEEFGPRKETPIYLEFNTRYLHFDSSFNFPAGQEDFNAGTPRNPKLEHVEYWRQDSIYSAPRWPLTVSQSQAEPAGSLQALYDRGK
jgi:hypothetical protein